MTTLSEHRTFLRSAMSRPALMGSPVPTGTRLATAIAAVVPTAVPTTVVELGAGTGALSPAIRARLAPGSRFVAVEVEPDLVRHLSTALPWLEVLEGDAGDIGTLLA